MLHIWDVKRNAELYVLRFSGEEFGVIDIARFSLMPEGEHKDSVLRPVVAVQRNIAARTKPHYQLAQFRVIPIGISPVRVEQGGSADARVGCHESELLLDNLCGPPSGRWVFPR